MGVSTFCLESTVSVPSENHDGALAALKRVFNEVIQAPTLPAALTSLSMQYRLDGGAISNIGFAGGKGDRSRQIWRCLAPFITDGSYVKTQIEDMDEIEVVSFDGGEMTVDFEEDDFEMSQAACEFFDRIEELEGEAVYALADSDINRAFEAEGTVDFLNYSRNTPLLALCEMAYGPEGYDNNGDDDLVDVTPAVKQLLKFRPDLNRANADGETPLTLAIAARDTGLVQLLLDNGADLAACPRNPIEVACEDLSAPMLDLLSKNGCKAMETDALVVACALHDWREDKLVFVQGLVEKHGCDVNRPAIRSHTACAGELQEQATPLMAAALAGDIEVLNYLIAKGANVDATDSLQNTALHYCSGQTWIGVDCGVAWTRWGGTTDVVQRLVLDGVSPTMANAAGKTSIQLAEEQGHEEALAVFNSVNET